MFRQLSKEAQEAIKDDSPLKPPWCFYPRGFPTRSPIHKLTLFKAEKRADWSYDKPKRK